jgi:RNA polymerase sigma-70 factor, ECF subfamily
MPGGVSALANGPAGGWARFADHYRDDAPRLAVFAMALGADHDRAAQLAHESLVVLWRRWDELSDAPGTNVREIAGRAGTRPHTADAPAGPLQFSIGDEHDAVLGALAALPDRQWAVLAATFDDLTPDAVAQVLDIDADSVGRTGDAARSALQELLGGQEARPAYEAMVAAVAEGMDVDAGLAQVAASAPARPDAVVRPAPAATGPGRGAGRRDTTEVPDELVAAAMTGDREAVAQLLEMIRPLVARYCRGRLGAVDRTSLSADDVAQEVCLAVLTALPNYRVQGRPFLAFVYGIAAHKVIDAHRAVSRARSEPVADVPDSIAVGAGPEQRALQGELSAQLRDLLDELPDKQREILVLRVVVGLSAEETAEIVGASPGAVRVAQHRALTRLRKSVVPGVHQVDS